MQRVLLSPMKTWYISFSLSFLYSLFQSLPKFIMRGLDMCVCGEHSLLYTQNLLQDPLAYETKDMDIHTGYPLKTREILTREILST